MKKGTRLVYAEKKFLLWLAAALTAHALVLFLLFYFQVWNPVRHPEPKIISVSLVSLPGSGGAKEISKEDGGGEPLSSQPPAAPSPPAPAVTKAVQSPLPKELPPSASLKRVPLEPLQPKPVAKPADLNRSLEQLKQQQVAKRAATPEAQPSPFAALKNSLAQLRLEQKVKQEGQSGGAGNGAGQGPSSGGRGGGISDPYKARVATIIDQNWEFSNKLVKNSDGMKVFVRINILANGTISQILFDQRAPSEYLNNSVKKAIEKSSPLPALPQNGEARNLWIGFVFTPKGIEK